MRKKSIIKPLLPDMDLLVAEIGAFAQKNNLSFQDAMSVYQSASYIQTIDNLSKYLHYNRKEQI